MLRGPFEAHPRGEGASGTPPSPASRRIYQRGHPLGTAFQCRRDNVRQH